MLNKTKEQHKGSKFLMAAATLTPVFAAALPEVTSSPVVQNIVANADTTTANSNATTSDAPNQANGISKDHKVKDPSYDTHAKNSANINDNGVGEGATSQNDRWSPVNTENSLAGNTGSASTSDANSGSASTGASSSASDTNTNVSTSNTTSDANKANNGASTSASAKNVNNNKNNQQQNNSQNDADTQQIINYVNNHAQQKAHIPSNAKLITSLPAGVKDVDELTSHGFDEYQVSVQDDTHMVYVYYNPKTNQFCAAEDTNNHTLLTKADLMGLFNLKHNNASDANGTNGTGSGALGTGASTALPGGTAGFGAGGLAQTNTQSGSKDNIALSALGLATMSGLALGLSGDKLKLHD